MCDSYETIWNFKTARFCVLLQYIYAYDCDLSWDETGEVRAKLESGEWGCYTFKVAVELDGREIGSDYLGGSIYADPCEFRDHIGLAAKARSDGRNYGSYFMDMVRGAIKEARKALANPPRSRVA